MEGEKNVKYNQIKLIQKMEAKRTPNYRPQDRRDSGRYQRDWQISYENSGPNRYIETFSKQTGCKAVKQPKLVMIISLVFVVFNLNTPLLRDRYRKQHEEAG